MGWASKRCRVPPLTDVRTVPRLDNVVHAKHLLLVPDKVLDRGDDSLALDTSYGLRSTNGLEHRICAEPFPDPTTQRLSPQRTNRWSQSDVDTFASEFFSQRNASSEHQALVPRSARGDTRGERGDIVCGSHSERRVLQAKLREAQTQGTARVSDARSSHNLS